MLKYRLYIISGIAVVLLAFIGFLLMQRDSVISKETGDKGDVILLSDAEWRKRLTPDEYSILRQGGTERPFTSDLLKEKRKGTYVTADCGEPVFRSEQKFETGTGWPSFWAPISAESVIEQKDNTMGLTRTEIVSPKCKSHLGHVFNDAPETPTGLRYCINGLALRFIPDSIQ